MIARPRVRGRLFHAAIMIAWTSSNSGGAVLLSLDPLVFPTAPAVLFLATSRQMSVVFCSHPPALSHYIRRIVSAGHDDAGDRG